MKLKNIFTEIIITFAEKIRSMSYEQIARLELLNAVNNINTLADLNEFKDLIARFFAAKAQKEIDELWDDDKINENTINAWGEEHMRTPYRHA
ncbi:MAG: hypothetical protein MJ000_11450 [Bacteroidales bacterium]|nr:hypothetical protein [Bacteroidales bacterium]